MYKIFKKFTFIKLEPYEILFREGEYGNHVYIVIDGDLQVSITKSFQERTREKLGSVVGAGEGSEVKMTEQEIRQIFLMSLVQAFKLKGNNNKIDWDTQKIVKHIGGGESFGELALTVTSRRTATIMALKQSHLIQLDRETFLSIMDQEVEETKHHTFIIQKNLPHLKINHMTELVVRMEKAEVGFGEILQDFDEPAHHMIIVKKGLLRIELKPEFFAQEALRQKEKKQLRIFGESNLREKALLECMKVPTEPEAPRIPVCLISKGRLAHEPDNIVCLDLIILRLRSNYRVMVEEDQTQLLLIKSRVAAIHQRM